MLGKITVIGGSGFVGTNFCQKLADRQIDFEIVDIKHSKRFSDKCKIADVRNIDSLRETMTGDVVINLAAVHRDDVHNLSDYYQTNVVGAGNVAQVCNEKGIKKIVFTSSVAVYGFTDSPTDEDGKINPFNEYGRSKYEAEEKLRLWCNKGDHSLIIVRPTVIFGEGNRGNVFYLMMQIASGRFIMVGSGKNVKSIAYVGNIVAFLEKCVESDKKYAVYNYTDTPDFNMNTLVRQVRKTLKGKDGIGLRVPYWFGLVMGYMADVVTMVTGQSLPLSSIRVKKFCSSTAFVSSKQDLDGFEPPFALQEGLDRTLHSEFIALDPKREIFFTE